jgi:hypothetical protein
MIAGGVKKGEVVINGKWKIQNAELGSGSRSDEGGFECLSHRQRPRAVIEALEITGIPRSGSA